jgi:hypothetical protein
MSDLYMLQKQNTNMKEKSIEIKGKINSMFTLGFH